MKIPMDNENQSWTVPSDIKLVKPGTNITNYPFDNRQVLSISIQLNPSGKYLSISIMDDATFNISYIAQVYNESLLFDHIPDHAQQNTWIVVIVYKEPIMSNSSA